MINNNVKYRIISLIIIITSYLFIFHLLLSKNADMWDIDLVFSYYQNQPSNEQLQLPQL